MSGFGPAERVEGSEDVESLQASEGEMAREMGEIERDPSPSRPDAIARRSRLQFEYQRSTLN